MKLIGKIFAVIVTVLILMIVGVIAYVNTALPAVENAPELSVELSPERIERGKYLANYVYLCTDCHSDRNYAQFAHVLDENNLGKGGNLFGLEHGFPGDFYAKNLTPYNLGDWTDGEIYRAITSGVDNEGEPMFPIMPYPNYAQVDPEDIYDIIAYLRTLEPVAHDVPESSAPFPMSMIMRTMPTNPQMNSKPDLSDNIAYGKYLVTAASCADCHTPIDERGGRLPGMDFAGGMDFHVPGGLVKSANITPDPKTGIGTWSEEAFVAAFKRFEDPNHEVNNRQLTPGEYNTSMPWRLYSKMNEEDLSAIYAYLQTLTPVSNTMERFVAVNE
ncbi:MAG: c-type cytochrome [Balneolaceae bacterium]|nr:c-type cytochrome [Balneolaceae bacterium]